MILRQGRSDAGSSAFGWLHALRDHNVSDEAVERVVSCAYPFSAPRWRGRYIAEFLVQGNDSEPFGVVTAYCKVPAKADPENKCPEWVNDSI